MKKTLFLTAMICNSICALAFRIEYGNNIIISRPEYGDLYLAGGNVTINAPIHGDLIIAGGTVIINDTVTNDILLAGGKVIFNGFVGDDIRCAGGKLRISKNVTGDVVITGGSIIIDQGVTVGGLLASGGDMTVDGNVNGEVRGAFGELFLNGNIVKDIDCRGGRITVNGNIDGKSVLAARNIIIGSNAAFNNDVRYWNKKGSLDFKQTLKNGKATYDPSLRIRTGEWYYLGAATVLGLLWYLGMAFLMVMIVQYLFSNTMKKAADTVFNSTLKSLGFGGLFFFAIPVAAVIFFITIIGVPVGILLIFAYIALILLATAITSVVGANWLNNRNNYKWNYWRMVFAAFGTFIVVKLISATPFLGWLIMILLVFIAFGSVLINVNWKRKQTETAIS
jgi:Polymer-forming cytoskeletal